MPGAVGFLLVASPATGALLIHMAVFGATVSYVLMMVSHIVLRRASRTSSAATARRAAS